VSYADTSSGRCSTYHVDQHNRQLNGHQLASSESASIQIGEHPDFLRVSTPNYDVQKISHFEVFTYMVSDTFDLPSIDHLPHLTVACPRGTSRSHVRKCVW
jgi:hypothetical protein